MPEGTLVATPLYAQPGGGSVPAPPRVVTLGVGLPGPAQLLTGKTLWVDGTNGSNTTAVRGDAAKPYLTLTAAKAAALSGDTVVVRPGTYDEKNLLKNGVNWHFEAGAEVVYTGDATAGGIFDDTATGANGAVTCRVTGRGRFRRGGSDLLFQYSYDNTPLVVVRIHNASSDVSIEAATLEFANTSATCHVVFHRAGTLRIAADRIVAEGSSTGIRWDGGPLHVRAGELAAATYAYYTGAQGGPAEPAAEGFLTVDTVRGAMVSTAFVDANLRTWFDVKFHVAAGSTAIEWVGGKMYHRSEKIEASVAASVAGGGVWLTSQKVTATQLVIHTAGEFYGEVLHAEQDAGGAAVFATLTASGFLWCGRMVTNAASSAAGLSFAGAGRFEGLIDTSANASANPVSLAASGGALQNAVLIAGGAANSIASGSPRTVTVLGTLRANTDFAGTVTVTDGIPIVNSVPRVPTAAPGTNTTQAASTAFVTTADNLKAPIASPTFTGTVTVASAGITTAANELVLQQTGDTLGTTRLKLRNRSGTAGALFENATLELMEFQFLGPGGTNGRSVRWENRGGADNFLGTPEFQLGTAANPTVCVADMGLLVRRGTYYCLATTPSQITADQNNYAPGVAGVLRLSTDASRTLTGLSGYSSPAGTVAEFEIWNVGSNNLVLAHESASSTAANRFLNSTGANITLAANEAAVCRYDATSARVRVWKRP